MKARLGSGVLGDNLVAIHAELVLGVAVKPDVAFLAVFLELRVGLCKLPRREHRLDRLGLGRGSQHPVPDEQRRHREATQSSRRRNAARNDSGARGEVHAQ